MTRRKSPNVCKSCPKMISLEKRYILTTLQKCLRMWEIWANLLLPKALKSCPKSKKSPNLVTLLPFHIHLLHMVHLSHDSLFLLLFHSLTPLEFIFSFTSTNTFKRGPTYIPTYLSSALAVQLKFILCTT